mgnify:CR=1 FL=1
MSYHPLMGVTFFFIIIFISYLLGRKVSINSRIKKKQNLKINLKNKKEKNISDLISPDASWLD